MAVETFEGFAPFLNATFSVELEASTVEMTLVQATKGKPQDGEGLRKEPFSLVFKCASPVILPQKLYPFRNSDFDSMDIFIVPLGLEPDGVVYQAVFN